MIDRIKRKGRYTVIANETLEDNDLSWGAKGLMAYLLSKPDDWQFGYRQLSRVGTNGEHSTRALLAELRDAGYLVTEKRTNAEGHWITEQVLHEVRPAAETETPSGGNRGPENRGPGNRRLIVSTETNDCHQSSSLQKSAGTIEKRRDLVFEATATACGIDWKELTKTARGPLVKAVAELKSVDATPEEISRRAGNYRTKFGPDVSLTPMALVKHWPSLNGTPRPAGPQTTFQRNVENIMATHPGGRFNTND